MQVNIVPWGGASPHFQARRHEADDKGQITIPRVRAGSVGCYPQPGGFAKADVEPGRITELKIEIEKGDPIAGIVVDENDAPVAGADIWLSDSGNDTEGAVATKSGSNGEFRVPSVRDASQHAIGARHARHGPSALVRPTKNSDGAYVTRLVLRGRAGSLRGVVLGPDGIPCVALVLLGSVKAQRSMQPFEARTDSEGRFHVEGLSLGRLMVGVRAARLCPWQGECVIDPNSETFLKIDLGAGASLHGRVIDQERRPIAAVDVRLGDYGDRLAGYSATTSADGAFMIEGLAPGRSHARAAKAGVGKVSAAVDLVAGETAECELTLERGLVIKGRVLGPDGSPLVGVHTHCATDEHRRDWASGATHNDGRFEFTNRPDADHRIWVEDPDRSFSMLALMEHVKPSEEEIVIRIDANLLVGATIEGFVIESDGRPIPSATVFAQQVGAVTSIGHEVDEKTGHFEIKDLPPGAYTLRALATDRTTVRLERVLVGGESWNAGTLVLAEKGGVIVTRILDQGVSGARNSISVIRTLDNRQMGRLVFTNDVAVLNDLDAGDYQLDFIGDGVRLEPTTFTVTAGQVARVEARILKAED